MVSKVMINRAPVLTLWAAVVAERLGYDHEAALTLGKAVAGLSAQSKGASLGIFGPPKAGAAGEERAAARESAAAGEAVQVALLERRVPAVRTPQGLRATNKGQPVDPQSVARYLRTKFGANLAEVQAALEALAATYAPAQLAERAYGLYERFRPAIPAGKAGWGAAGELDLEVVRGLAKKG